MSSTNKINVLIIGATGKQGSPLCTKLVAAGKYNVYGTSRGDAVPPETATPTGTTKPSKLQRLDSAKSKKKLETSGVIPVAFKYHDKQSIEDALEFADPQYVFFLTDFMGAGKSKASNEIAQGKIIIDALVKKGTIQHVVFSSVGDADIAKEVTHFTSKGEIEVYLKTTALSFTILRPTMFYENFDDAATWNPLTKGALKGLSPPDLKVKMCGCEDIANTTVVVFNNPTAYKGKTIDIVACDMSGNEMAAILSEVSGVPCKYSPAIPSFILWLVMHDMYKMVDYFGKHGYTADIDEFKKVVPNPIGVKEFFQSKGQWANGEKFATK